MSTAGRDIRIVAHDDGTQGTLTLTAFDEMNIARSSTNQLNIGEADETDIRIGLLSLTDFHAGWAPCQCVG